MSDRRRALEILKKARELLASRLTDRIIDLEEEDSRRCLRLLLHERNRDDP